LVNLIACQNGWDKAKLLNFKPEWLRDCNNRSFGKRRDWNGIPGAAGCAGTGAAGKEFRYEFGIIAVRPE
jgi:hypothetical protein